MKLVLRQKSTSAKIRMGFADESGALPSVVIAGAAQLPGLSADGSMRLGVRLGGDPEQPSWVRVVAGHLTYKSAAARPLVASVVVQQQRSSAAQSGADTSHRQSERLHAGWGTECHSSVHLPASVSLRHKKAQERSVYRAVVSQAAIGLPASVSLRHKKAQERSVYRAVVSQAAIGLPASVSLRHQDTLRVHVAAAAAHQTAKGLSVLHAGRIATASALILQLAAWSQEAIPPAPGITRGPVPPTPQKPICYDPATVGKLIFDEVFSGRAKIIFRCLRAAPPAPSARYAIPILRVYMTAHSLSARRIPEDIAVSLLDVSISTDDDSWCWSLQASGPESLLDQLAPGAGGLPARVLITIDGIEWIFAIERLARSRKFGQHRVQVQGRSVTALLTAPYMPPATIINAEPRTAQQCIVEALEFTGTELVWNADDWTLPAGVWSYSGTPLGAALRVAESIGAIVRSDRVAQRLTIAPRYAVEPWDWASTTPDIVMPADVIVTDSLEPDNSPPYNAVYVSGQAQGISARIKRAGTAGEVLAPQIVDALITDQVAARQRGIAVLGAAGKRQKHTLDMPLLTGGTAPGLIAPGYFLHVDDVGGAAWRGLVRGLQLRASLPVVRQTITVERT